MFSLRELWLTALLSIGMERYKLPAGRLATIFYKAEPKAVASVASSSTSDNEKGGLDEDVPPRSADLVTAQALQAVSSHDGRVLAWKNIVLELKVHGKVKRLLDGISGKTRRTPRTPDRTLIETGAGFVEPGQLTALMGASGAGKVGGIPHAGELSAD